MRTVAMTGVLKMHGHRAWE